MRTRPEVLAPAGNIDCFYAALGAGANAIYLGLDKLNARQGAANFSLSTLERLIPLAHAMDTKVYITVNVVVLDRELEEAQELVSALHVLGADAVIVQDIGLISLIHSRLPQVRIHASTQINAHDSATVRTLATMGVSRVTLARECSLHEIETLVAVGKEVGVEIEAFCHGALCVCYSGQCLFSSLVGRRSANRGQCAQPCRLPYELIDRKNVAASTEGAHLLSPNDLRTTDYIDQYGKAGVASLKIEGRMKSPEYVATSVANYAQLLDLDESEDNHDEIPSLHLAYNRGTTSAYLDGKSDNDMMNYRKGAGREYGEELKEFTSYCIERAKNFTLPLDFEVVLCVGKPAIVTVGYDGAVAVAQGDIIEPARTAPLSEENVVAHINRLGGTPYTMNSCNVELGGNPGMGFSQLHKLRRQAILNFEEVRNA